MAVYVDDRRAKFRGMLMCHMVADTTEELNEMADRIGVHRTYIQAPGTYKEHYDICLTKRKLAVKHGAKQISVRELGDLLVKKRNEMKPGLYAFMNIGDVK